MERQLWAGNVASLRPSASQTGLSSMEKLTKTSSTRSSHRWKNYEWLDVSSKDVLAKLTVEEATGSSLDTKADGISEPEAEPELGASTAAGSGGYKNFVSGTTVFFILSTIYFS